MKKIILSIIVIVLIFFLIPIFLTKRFDAKSTMTNDVLSDNKNNIGDYFNSDNKYDYKEYEKVKLLHVKTGEIVELDLDEYLLGVVSSEMPASYEEEALKAQAVVARTYTIYKMKNKKHENADICDDPTCCQAWISKEERLEKWNEEDRQSNWEKIKKAVEETKGKVITYNGEIINAFFHSNSGGTTDTVSSVWGGENLPYLQSVTTSGEDSYSQYNSELELSKAEFINKIKEYHSDFNIDFTLQNQIEILSYTEGGRIEKIRIGNLELSGVEIRNIFSLKSARFTIEIGDENIKFKVIGYGHGVGMSQTGADSMAKKGSNYEDIIKHFYTGIEIKDI